MERRVGDICRKAARRCWRRRNRRSA
ncbi:MAG: hypothetical protein ACLR8P_11630 [Clostridium fessum]